MSPAAILRALEDARRTPVAAEAEAEAMRVIDEIRRTHRCCGSGQLLPPGAPRCPTCPATFALPFNPGGTSSTVPEHFGREEPSARYIPRTGALYTNPLLAAAFNMGLREEQMIDLLTARCAEQQDQLMRLAELSTPTLRVMITPSGGFGTLARKEDK